MKRSIIILSAIFLIFSLMVSCSDNNDQLVEIDPFEGVDLVYHHIEGGNIEEKGICSTFDEPTEKTVDNSFKSIQILSYQSSQGAVKCRELGCDIQIYREVFDKELKEGDTVTLHLLIDNEDISEDRIPSYLKKKYGIKLTQTTKDITVHFEEDPVLDIDPFEGAEVVFSKKDDGFTYEEHVKDCKGADNSKKNDIDISYVKSLAEGRDINDLYIDDVIRYTIQMKADGKTYTGEAVNKYLDSNWKGVHFTKTEKDFVVFPGEQSSMYSSNINVMLNRPENWHKVVKDKSRLNKYDIKNIDGSTATVPITAELVRQFCNAEDSHLRFYIDHNTTGPAYENLIFGKKDKNIIFVTEPSQEELAMAAENNVELDVTQIALDGFVFITHKDNPVDSLTVEQIQDIYSGKITNWKDVGGNDEEIIPFTRETNSGSQTVMENVVMNGIPIAKNPRSNSPIDAMASLIEQVAGYHNSSHSIGYTFYYYINNLYKNEDIKVLKINGVSPDNENLLDKSYPFSSGYYAVTVKGKDKNAEKIKEYLLSDEGQEIIKLAGYCPVR